MQRRILTPDRALLHLILIIGSVAMAYPLVFALIGSFATVEAYAKTETPWLPIPNVAYIGNYIFIFSTRTPVLRWIVNTAARTAWYILLPGTIAVLCGYVFARLRFRGRNFVFLFLLSSMMAPGIVYQVPHYVMLARWPLVGGNNIWGQGGSGFINHWPALLIPGIVNAYYIFLLRQTFYSIPTDFEEAARVDGATTPQILWRIYLPMLKPALLVMVIFQFVANWNDYMWPLIVAGGNQGIWPVALGFQRIMLTGASIKSQAASNVLVDYPFAFAVATLATLPPVLVFLFLQRYFVEGIQGFAIKG
jgi:multiple sugar transport system permease protein